MLTFPLRDRTSFLYAVKRSLAMLYQCNTTRYSLT